MAASSPKNDKVLRWITILSVAIVCVYWLHTAKTNGWLSHPEKTILVYPKHEWQVGEYITCLGSKPDENAVHLDCGGQEMETGVTREIDVNFWGPVPKDPAVFECKRDDDGIGCHNRTMRAK
jgi:hypothetical protein